MRPMKINEMCNVRSDPWLSLGFLFRQSLPRQGMPGDCRNPERWSAISSSRLTFYANQLEKYRHGALNPSPIPS